MESKNKKPDRNIAGTSNDNDTERPDLKDLRSAIHQSFKYRGKNAENLPILLFIRKWWKLEKGWASVLLSGSLLPPKSKNHLSEHERNIVGYNGVILSATRNSTWADEVAFAFGTVGNTVRKTMEQLLKHSHKKKPKRTCLHVLAMVVCGSLWIIAILVILWNQRRAS